MHAVLPRDIGEVGEMVSLPCRERLHVHHGHSFSYTFLQEHLIDVATVVVRFNHRLKWRCHLLGHEIIPVDFTEPLMTLNILCIFDSPCRISVQKAKQQILHFWGEKFVHLDVFMDPVLQHFVLVGTIEGWVTAEHFINESTETPPIHTLIMTCAGYYLWGHVFWCSTK